MENDKLKEPILIEMTPQDVQMFTFMLETTVKAMLYTHTSPELMVRFKEAVTPLAEKIATKMDEKVNEINTQDALDTLKIRFTDKNSPKDKSND